ncbi:MAG: hypothetical protein VCA57_08470 [Pseudomonas sp.]|uniref:hypothetical protein n=1 Tax=Pseudomonas sp. TaxID=306 RepID=UPI0039819D39
MSYKSIILAVLLVSLSGCAVYGGGYGHPGYDRYYSTTYYQTQPYPVYVVPQQRYPAYRYDERRYAPPRHYVPAPPPRHYQSYKPQGRADYRVAPPRAHNQRHDSGGQQQSRPSRNDVLRGANSRDDNRRGWERQR